MMSPMLQPSLPYYTGFEDDEDGTLWTMVNKDHPSTYGVYGFAISPTGYASSYGNSTRTLTAGSGGRKILLMTGHSRRK